MVSTVDTQQELVHHMEFQQPPMEHPVVDMPVPVDGAREVATVGGKC